MLDVLSRHRDDNVAELDRLSHQYPGWFLMSSNSAWVASRSRLSSGNSAFRTCASRAWSPFQPAGARSRMMLSIFMANLTKHNHVLRARFRHLVGPGPSHREDPRQVVVDHCRLALAVQGRMYALVGLLRDQPLHQRFGPPQELLIRSRFRPILA